jgi:hypothetical protein
LFLLAFTPVTCSDWCGQRVDLVGYGTSMFRTSAFPFLAVWAKEMVTW